MKQKIRATITVEVPYSNELMNNGTKLDKEIRKVIDNSSYISSELESGHLKPSRRPVLRIRNETIN